MAVGSVGKLSITVYPDTRKFRENLRKALERIEKQVKAEIEVTPVVRRQAVADLRRSLKEQLKGVDAVVSPQVSREGVERVKEKLDGLDAKAKVKPDVDSGKAKTQLAVLARDRVVTLNVRLAKGSAAAAMTSLKALSGGNLIGKMGGNLKNLGANLDTISVKMAATGTAALNLSSVAMSAVSGIATFGTSLAAAAPAALALPGILGAAGAGAGVLIAALKDTGTVLADLKPALSGLQDSISASFWAQAAAPIRALASQAMPMLNASLSQVASGFGQMGAALAQTVGGHIAGFQSTFAALSAAVQAATPGVAAFADGLMSLGEVGAQFLPSMAQWGTQVSQSFQQWANNGLADGSIAASIQNAWGAVKQLGSLFVQVGGVIQAVFSAIAESGPGSLTPATEALKQINAALSGGPGRDALVQIFTAAREATAALAPGLSQVGNAFVQITPVLGQIMTLAGQVASVALGGIAQALQSLANSGGVQAFFQGVLQAVQALAPAMPALGQAFGAVAAVAGQLLGALGPLVAQLITALAPVVVQLADALTPIISMLQAALMPVINALAPVIETLVSALMPLITQILAALLPALVPIVQAIAGALVPAIQLIGTVIQALMPIITTVIDVVSNVITAVLTVLQGLINFVTGVLSGNWSQAWEGIKQVFSGVWDAIKALISGGWEIIKSLFSAALNILSNLWSTAWGAISSALSGIWNGIKSGVSSGISAVVNLVKSLPSKAVSALGNVGSALVNSGKALINGFKDGIMSAFNAVKNAVSNGLSKIRSLFPFSPAKEGPFSGRGWVLYSGLSIGAAMADGIDRSSGLAEAAAGRLAKSTQAQISKINSTAALNASMSLNAGAGDGEGGLRGGSVVINQYNPVTAPASSVRDAAAAGIRMAALV